MNGGDAAQYGGRKAYPRYSSFDENPLSMDGAFVVFHQSSRLLNRFRRIVRIVETGQIDLPAVNAAFGIDLREGPGLPPPADNGETTHRRPIIVKLLEYCGALLM